MTTGRSVLLLALLGVFWGLNWPIMKIGLADVPPWTYRMFASVSGAVGLLLIARLSGHSIRVPRGAWPGLSLAALLNFALWNVLVLYGIDLMNSGRAAILAYTMPLWASLFSVWLLGERLGARRILALALGMGAMALLFVGGEPTAGSAAETSSDSLPGPHLESLLGPLLVVLAAMAWGLGTVVVKRQAFAMPVTALVGWQHLIGVVPIAVVALAWEIHTIEQVSTPAALAVLYNMTVTAIFCYWAYFKTVSSLPVVVSTVGTLAVPILGVAFTALIFNEPPKLTDYLALAGVVAAMALVMWPSPSRHATR